MRMCHQCFVHCFGGLLGLHFNTLDLFVSLSIHLAGFLHVGLICFIFFLSFCFFRRRPRVCVPHGRPWPVRGDRPGHAGRKRWRLGPGVLGCASCRLNHEQGSRCARDGNANAACPGQPLCHQLSSPRHAPRPPCACPWPCRPSEPLLQTPGRKEQGLFSSTESRA